MSALHVQAHPVALAGSRRLPSTALVALRRSAGAWGFVALVAVELANAFARNRVWAIEWQWTAYWSNTTTFLVCPFTAAIAAGESVLYRRRGTELMSVGRGRARLQLGRVTALAIWAMGAHLIGVLACAMSAASLHGDWRLPLLPILPAFAALVGSAFAGAALGWGWPSLAAPPLVAVFGAGLLTVVNLGRLDAFLRVDDATYSLSGLVTRPTFTVVAVGWWLAVALGGAWALVRRGRFGLGDGVIVVLLVVGAVGVQIEGDHRFATDPGPIAVVCAGGRPQLCVDSDYRPRLRLYAGPLDRLAAALREVDPAAVPDRFVAAGQRTAGSPPIDGVGVVSLDPSGPVNLANLALDLAKTASACPAAPYRGDGPLWAGELKTAAWLLQQSSPASVQDLPAEPPRSIEQARSVVAALPASC